MNWKKDAWLDLATRRPFDRMSERRLLKGTQMDKEEFILAIMFVIVFVGGIVLTATIASTETEQKVVNQLCQKQQYDFCEIDGYKMKGDLK